MTVDFSAPTIAELVSSRPFKNIYHCPECLVALTEKQQCRAEVDWALLGRVKCDIHKHEVAPPDSRVLELKKQVRHLKHLEAGLRSVFKREQKKNYHLECQLIDMARVNAELGKEIRRLRSLLGIYGPLPERKKSSEAKKASRKKYYDANREKFAEARKARRLANPEKARERARMANLRVKAKKLAEALKSRDDAE